MVTFHFIFGVTYIFNKTPTYLSLSKILAITPRTRSFKSSAATILRVSNCLARKLPVKLCTYILRFKRVRE